MTFLLFILIGLTVNAQTINVHGVVSNKAGKPISNAIVTLMRQGLKDTTGTDGAYSIVKTGIAVLPSAVPDAKLIHFGKGVLELSLNKPSAVKVEIFDAQGSLLKELLRSVAAGACRLKIMDNILAANLLIIRVSIGGRTMLFRYLPPNSGEYTVRPSGEYDTKVGGGLARLAAVIDTLKITVAGYTTKTTAISSFNQTVNITLDSMVTFSFLSPVANAVWNVGTPNQIQWTPDTSFLGSSIILYLYKGSQSLYKIASGPNSGSVGVYTYTVPSGLSTGNDYRIKIANYSNAAVSKMSDQFTIKGIERDAYEPDDSMSAAKEIATANSPQSHTLTLNDNDWFTFRTYSSPIEDIYFIKITDVAPAMPLQLTLYNHTRQELVASDTSSTADPSATIVLYPSANTKYLFEVASSFISAYTVSVKVYKSTDLRLTVLSPAGNITLSTKQTTTITWASLGIGGNVDIVLFKSGSAVNALARNVANNGTYEWTIDANLTPGSNYNIQVVSKYDSRIYGTSGGFSISAN
jgi:hypothetical protein